MRFRRSHHRHDLIHADTVDVLLSHGFLVHDTSCVGCGFPDLIVGYPSRWELLGLELKSGAGAELSPKEKAWHAVWRGFVAESAELALQICREAFFV